MWKPIGLLVISNIFMTYAWYGHLKDHKNTSLYLVILLSWGVAFFEYCFQVPANRIGTQYFSIGQLKIIQEILSISIFMIFSIWYLKEEVSRNFIYASLCILAAVFFIFRDKM